MRVAPTLIAAMLLAVAAHAAAAPGFTLVMPGPAVVAERKQDPIGNYRMPLGPWRDGAIKTRDVEGAVRKTAWRIADPRLSTMQILIDLRSQLQKAGFEILFQCETRDCGGYDFRFHTDVLAEPQMHVDLGDFRFLSAQGEEEGDPVTISLLISRSADSGFVQVIRVGKSLPAPGADQTAATTPDATPAPVPSASASLMPPAPSASFIETLRQGGSVVLDGLDFPSGSTDLADKSYPVLEQLAAFLKAHPDQHAILVGHTDDSGSLDANIAVSKRRAQSVKARLEKSYGVDAGQLEAEGVGFLAPRASNLTAAGREQNRRVEVMLTPTQSQ
ncbi:OmpA family protein [Thioclava sp. BHET1]|nr:OmpA family protein [Thioclava sp. BHET1]